MRCREMTVWLFTVFICAGTSGSEHVIPPVTPNAAPEAVELLKLIHGISGRHTMTGQHNYPNTKDKYTQLAAKNWGKIPAIYGQDWGFAKEGDQDSYLARPEIVAECKRQYGLGSIVAICWHAAPPTADEPVTFRPSRGEPTPAKLASVQGKLTDEQFKDVLTPGTELYKRWCTQVDTVAGFLKQLQQARVPVLWRPYHEMNGDWFWWGGRRGEYSTARLYRQMYDRYVNYHKLNNLVWVWSVDRPERADRQFVDYYPGADYFDIAALDVYGEFKQSYYDDLLKVAAGKPLALAEVGRAPTLEILAKQPGWTWWMTWAGMGGGRRGGEGPNPMQVLVNDPRSWSLSDPDYAKAISSLRKASGLPPVPPAPQIPLSAALPRFEYHKIAEVGNQMGQTSLVDIDKDGDLDWVVGERARTWWFEYVGPDRWIQHDLGQGARTDVGGTAFDIDGDGWIDQVAGTGWYRNTGKPRTEPFVRYDNGAIFCHDDVAADVNGDGKLEVVACSNDKSHVVTVWYEIPKIPRDPWIEHKIGGGIHGGVGPRGVGDLDGDGDNDVVRGDVWFENVDGKGVQWKERTGLTPPGGNRPERYGLAIKVWVCDMDRDGDLDIVEAEADAIDARVLWFENQDKARIWQCHLISADHTKLDFHSLAVADFDNDGDLDAYSGGGPLSRAPLKCFIWENTDSKGGQWQEHTVLEGRECHEAKAADVDGDGDIDICTKPWNGNLHFYLRNMLVEDAKKQDK